MTLPLLDPIDEQKAFPGDTAALTMEESTQESTLVKTNGVSFFQNFVAASVTSVAVTLTPVSAQSSVTDQITQIEESQAPMRDQEFEAETDRVWTNKQLADFLNRTTIVSSEPDIPFEFDPDDYPVR